MSLYLYDYVVKNFVFYRIVILRLFFIHRIKWIVFYCSWNCHEQYYSFNNRYVNILLKINFKMPKQVKIICFSLVLTYLWQTNINRCQTNYVYWVSFLYTMWFISDFKFVEIESVELVKNMPKILFRCIATVFKKYFYFVVLVMYSYMYLDVWPFARY